MQSIDPGFGERFTEELRHYLKKEGMVNREGQPSLGKMSGKMLAEEIQRFFDFTMGVLSERKKARTEAKVKDTAARKAFVPPSPAEVEAYSKEIRWPMNGQHWCDHYAQKDWMVGKMRMKDWKAAVRNWKANKWLPSAPGTKQNSQLEMEAFIEPPGWLDFMRSECPDWIRLVERPQIIWAKLRDYEKKQILELMGKGRSS